MENCDIGGHLLCNCYDSLQASLIKLLRVESGEDTILCKSNRILYLIEGKLSYLSDDGSNRELTAGDLLFLCGGSEFSFNASMQGKAISICMDGLTYLCPKYNVGDLYYYHKDRRPDIKGDRFYPIKASDRVCYFMEGLLDIMETGLRCKNYMIGEVKKLLMLLLAYYPKEELYRFFYPVLSPDMEFSDYVRANFIEAGNIVKLAERMHLTVPQFTRRFNRVFGETPREWIIREKAKHIYRDVCDPSAQLKGIAVKYGYYNQANFVRFFKRIFGMAPGELRKISLAANRK